MICPNCGKDSDSLLPDQPVRQRDFAQARWPSPEALVHLFNEKTPNNVPAVEVLSPLRRKKAIKALKVFPERTQWERVFEEWRKSKFLSGRAAPGNGHANWTPTFDWLLSNGKTQVEVFVAIHDGAYSS